MATTIDAPAYCTRHPETDQGVQADWTDDQLAAQEKKTLRKAAKAGVTITGLGEYLRHRRWQLRNSIVLQLPLDAAAVSTADEALRRARQARDHRLAQITAWEDPLYANHSELAQMAGMTKQSLAEMFTRRARTRKEPAQ